MFCNTRGRRRQAVDMSTTNGTDQGERNAGEVAPCLSVFVLLFFDDVSLTEFWHLYAGNTTLAYGPHDRL